MGDLIELPQEFIAMLPLDPYEQLAVANKITSMAMSARVSELERETVSLRDKLDEKETTIFDMQHHVSELEQSLQETMDKLSSAIEEQARLREENASLSETVKKLNRDVSKLETFKRTLMQSLQDEDEPIPPKKDIVEEKVSSSPVPDSSYIPPVLSKSDTNTRITSFQSAAEIPIYTSILPEKETPSPDVKTRESTINPDKISIPIPSQIAAEITPTGSPKIKRPSTVSPTRGSVTNSPRIAARISLPSSAGSIGQSTFPGSPPPQSGSTPVRTPRVDGKEFFRQARNRLSYEQFSAFLGIIKELNAHRQTKEETLKKADEIFGSDNKDLYAAFDGLLSRHLPT